jgi:hypothetical protein
VRFEVGNNAVDVYFNSSEFSKLTSVNKGGTITVIGTCVGFNRPNTEDTAEILRILGAGRSVNIIDAIIYVTLPPVQPTPTMQMAVPTVELMDYPGTVDAVVTLQRTMSFQDNFSHTEKRSEATNQKDAEGKTIYREVDVKIYERSGTIIINYEIVRTRDGSIIGQGTKRSAPSRKYNYSGNPPSAAQIESQMKDKDRSQPLNDLVAEMVPTERTMSVTLAKDNNKEAKKEMGEAKKMVKAKDYKAAAAAYGAIYAKYKNFAAGYNQAVLTEAAEGTAAAIVLMEALVNETGESTAINMLAADMKMRNAANQQAAQQLAR